MHKRSYKYLFCSWAPAPNNRNQQRVSDFFYEVTSCDFVLTKESKSQSSKTLLAKPRKDVIALELTFSELRYYFECPYLFKLRFLYGFDTPISQALGYGKSLHDALAEIHAESIRGNIPDVLEVPRLVDDHLHLPFANSVVQGYLRGAAQTALTQYLEDHKNHLNKLEHVEKVIELKLDEGIVVNGRIDLIRTRISQFVLTKNRNKR